jgi:DNA-binding NarL/FixJ family response regulator
MAECAHCNATDDEEQAIIVGVVEGGGETICTVCRSDALQERTVLPRREAQVAAHKQITGASNATIAARLGLATSTVDEYYARLQDRVTRAATTLDELPEYV